MGRIELESESTIGVWVWFNNYKDSNSLIYEIFEVQCAGSSITISRMTHSIFGSNSIILIDK